MSSNIGAGREETRNTAASGAASPGPHCLVVQLTSIQSLDTAANRGDKLCRTSYQLPEALTGSTRRPGGLPNEGLTALRCPK